MIPSKDTQRTKESVCICRIFSRSSFNIRSSLISGWHQFLSCGSHLSRFRPCLVPHTTTNHIHGSTRNYLLSDVRSISYVICVCVVATVGYIQSAFWSPLAPGDVVAVPLIGIISYPWIKGSVATSSSDLNFRQSHYTAENIYADPHRNVTQFLDSISLFPSHV